MITITVQDSVFEILIGRDAALIGFMIMTWSSPRFTPISHSLVQSEHNSYFVGICRAHIYSLTCFLPLYVVLNVDLITTKKFLDTNLFSNVAIMTLNYVLYPILV